MNRGGRVTSQAVVSTGVLKRVWDDCDGDVMVMSRPMVILDDQ